MQPEHASVALTSFSQWPHRVLAKRVCLGNEFHRGRAGLRSRMIARSRFGERPPSARDNAYFYNTFTHATKGKDTGVTAELSWTRPAMHEAGQLASAVPHLFGAVGRGGAGELLAAAYSFTNT